MRLRDRRRRRRDRSPRCARAPVEAVGAGEEGQVLFDAEIAVEREFLRHVAEPRARRRGRLVEIEAVDQRRARASACNRPHIILKVVDLPAPLGPSRPKISPRLISNEMWSAAVKAPKRRVSARALTGGAPSRARRASRVANVSSRLGCAAERGDESVLEARRRGCDLGACGASAISLGCGGAAPSAMTRRTRFALHHAVDHVGAAAAPRRALRGARRRRRSAGRRGRRPCAVIAFGSPW